MKRGKPKGSLKTGGRKAGSQNKVTIELKLWIQQLIDGNRPQLEKDLRILEPKDRWAVIDRLMQYTIPKMGTAELKIDYNNLTDVQLTGIIDELTKNIDENESVD